MVGEDSGLSEEIIEKISSGTVLPQWKQRFGYDAFVLVRFFSPQAMNHNAKLKI